MKAVILTILTILVAVNGQYFSEHSHSTLNRNGKRSPLQQMLRSSPVNELNNLEPHINYDQEYDAELYKPFEELARNPNIFEQFRTEEYDGLLSAILMELLKEEYQHENNEAIIGKILGGRY